MPKVQRRPDANIQTRTARIPVAVQQMLRAWMDRQRENTNQVRMNEIKTHDTMSPEAQRIATAMSLGWDEESARRGFETIVREQDGYTYSQISTKLPDYLNDLNACHEFEKVLSTSPEYMQQHAFNNYAYLLIEMCKHQCNAVSATAAQRCEAFLRTIGKWRGEA